MILATGFLEDVRAIILSNITNIGQEISDSGNNSGKEGSVWFPQ